MSTRKRDHFSSTHLSNLTCGFLCSEPLNPGFAPNVRATSASTPSPTNLNFLPWSSQPSSASSTFDCFEPSATRASRPLAYTSPTKEPALEMSRCLRT
ncbi:hypothetical protein KCU83_g69, partial [Aureobasidium melanogenum]